MRMASTMLRLAGIAVLIASPVRAQTGVLTGRVVRDASGTELAGADISIPGLQRSTTANYRGEFRLDRLPAGRYAVSIRAVGFAPLSDTVTFGEGARVDREFLLDQKIQTLDTVTTAAPERKYISPGLQEFEERRKGGHGYFISEEALRKEDNRNMLNVVTGRIPGLTRFRLPRSGYYIGTARKCAAGPTILACRNGPNFCPVTLYINGSLIFDASNTKDPADFPNIESFRPEDYAGVEFFPGGSTTPVKYNATSSGCGTLLLWTRER